LARPASKALVIATAASMPATYHHGGQLVRFILLLLVAVIAARPSLAAATTDIAAEITRALEEEKLVGATWSLVDGDTVSLGAAGLKNAKMPEALQADARMHIGSVTKTLVATGVLRLVTQGLLDLDAPVEPFLPGLRFSNPWASSNPVRVRHLLDHTSGLEDARLWQVFSAHAKADTPLIAAFERDTSVLRLRTRPGERFSYSNMGYTLAAMVIERVTGQHYESWLNAQLLMPLGMTHSDFHFISQTGAAADARLAWGHNDSESPQAALPIFLRPSGQFTTTAADMAKLAQFLMSNGTLQGKIFVRPQLLRAMGAPHGTAAQTAGLATGYGLGLVTRDRDGGVGRCHLGDIIGFHSAFCLFPDAQKAFFIAINTDTESANHTRFNAILIEALGLPAAAPEKVTEAHPDFESWSGRYVPAPSRFALATYVDQLTSSMMFTADGSAYLWSGPNGKIMQLVPVGGWLLRASDRRQASHVLLRSDTGDYLISDGTRSWRRIHAAVYWSLWTSCAAGICGFLYGAFAAPIGVRRTRAFKPRPLTWLLLPIIATGLLFLSQPFVALGDQTPAAMLLWLTTCLLPLAALWQLVAAIKSRAPGYRAEAIACLAVIQLCAVLGLYGMLPLALWR
jgi:CubicO group peptidase (beta-lactamase class C family)